VFLSTQEGCNIYNQLSVEVKQQARHADLYDFLMRVHPMDVVREGNCLRLKNKPGVVLKRNYCGFNDYINNTTGNSVDLLTGYLGYSFCEAVEALSGQRIAITVQASIQTEQPHNMDLPLSSSPPFTRVYAYLTKSRGVSARTVQRIIDAGLLYQDAEHGNAVFVSRERDYCEIRGTLTYGKPFHGCKKAKSDNYWSFGRPTGEHPTAYICEAAIDAMSLYEILRAKGPLNAVFCSIGGVGNQKTIDRIAARYAAILAVDNDDAGAKCRERNPGIPFILPSSKDWNQDLMLKLKGDGK